MESDPPPSVYLACIFLFPAPLISFTGAFIAFFILFLLLAFSALVSGSEVAYFSLSPNDMQSLKDRNDGPAKRVIHLMRRPRRLLATILIANNFINIAIVLLSDYLVWQFFGIEQFANWGQKLSELFSFFSFSPEDYSRLINFLITVVGVSFLLVFFGEVTPKIYAKFNNLRFSRMMSASLQTLGTIFYPISNLLVGLSSKMDKSLSVSANTQDHKDEIEEAIEMTVSGDQHAEEEVDILKSIIKFNEVAVKQIMRSRMDVIAESTESTLEEVLETIRSSGFSRFPIYEESLDQVVGLLYAKDFLGHDDSIEWQKLIRKDVHYVPETKRINDLLKEFQQRRMHMAIVVDEFGGVSGLVTLEDVMEEVIGEIKDEFDEGDDLEYVKLNDKTYIFEGKSLINDVCRVLHVDTGIFDELKGEADSVAGLMLEHIGQIPRQYQEVKIKNFTLRAERVNKRRIEKVRIILD